MSEQETETQEEAVEEAVEAPAEPLTLRQKLLGVQRELCMHGVAKTGQGTKYPTRSIDTLITAMSSALTKHRVVLTPEVAGITRDKWATQSGGALHHTLVEMRYRFEDADSDTTEVTTFYGEGSDALDKSLQKAITNAYKYLMIQKFQIPVEPSSDPDMQQTEDEQIKDTDGEPLAPPEPEKKISEDDLSALRAIIESTETDEALFCNFLKTDSLANLPLSKFAGAMGALRQKEQSMQKRKESAENSPVQAVKNAMKKGGKP
jgi:hypothetical protein